MSAHGWTGHGRPCCRQPGPPADARPSAIALCDDPVVCGSCVSDAARIHASGTQGEQGAGLLVRVAQLEAELDHWRSGRRVKGLPRIESVPDGIQYAARLARAIGTEGGEDHDALLAEAAQRMKGLHDAAAHLLQEAVVLRGRVTALEAERDTVLSQNVRLRTSERSLLKRLDDRAANDHKSRACDFAELLQRERSASAQHVRHIGALKGDLDDAMNRHDQTCSILTERDAMRPVVAAAGKLRGTLCDCLDHGEAETALMRAWDAYRAEARNG